MKAVIELRSLRVLAVLAFWMPVIFAPVWAGEYGSYDTYMSYDEKIRRAREFPSLGEELFGDRINLQDGSVSFVQNDIVLATNSELQVMFGRKTPSSDQGKDGAFAIFGIGWEPNIPYMMGTYDTRVGWDTRAGWGSAASMNRCSEGSIVPSERVGPWPYYHQTLVRAHMWWHGINIYIPGMGEEKLLEANASQRMPTDGKNYIGTTKSLWRVSCLPSVKNDVGEGFAVTTPNGLVYHFDWMAKRNAIDLTDNGDSGRDPITGDGKDAWHLLAPLTDVFLYASKVEDRFGNYISYTYDENHPNRVTSIQSSDGLRIDIQYNSSGQVGSATSSGQRWVYSYIESTRPARGESWPSGYYKMFNQLVGITLPDGAQWKFQETGNPADNLIDGRFWTDSCRMEVGANTSTAAPLPRDLSSMTITHPSGAVGEFKLRNLLHGTNNTPGGCTIFWSSSTSGYYGTYGVPAVYATMSLYSKRIYGPGMQDRTWSYQYAPTWSFDPEWGSSVSKCSNCSKTSSTVVTTNDGVIRRHVFGNDYKENLGQHLSETVEKDGVVLRKEVRRYHVSTSGQPFPLNAGDIPVASNPGFTALPPTIDRDVMYGNKYEFYNRPINKIVIAQDGVEFTQIVQEFDAYARPITITSSRSK